MVLGSSGDELQSSLLRRNHLHPHSLQSGLQPSSPYGFTLNAIVCTLATAPKSSLIYATGSVFELDEVQLFDSASRGPLGSLFMIIHHKGQSLVSLEVTLTILVLNFAPFVQQALTYPTRLAEYPDGSGFAAAKQT
ncbi:hypothetical protein BDW68DRAFT_143839 [Aspergillus falconensis]